MITSIDLIKQYCALQGLTLLKSFDDVFETSDQILHLTDNGDYVKMANLDLKYSTKVLRVVKIKLNVDVGLDSMLLPANELAYVVHFEKNEPLTNIKRKYVFEYLNFVDEAFFEKLSTDLISKVKMPQLLGKIKQTNNKIFWQELTSQIVPILQELKEYNFKATMSADKLALRNNKYVWNWI